MNQNLPDNVTDSDLDRKRAQWHARMLTIALTRMMAAERDAAITQAKHLSDWAGKMHDEMLHQSARANEWREEAIRLAAALRIWSGIYHPGVPELVEFEKMKKRKP